MATESSSRIIDRTIDRIHADSRRQPGGFTMPSPHCHPHYEIFYIEDGEASFFIGNGMYELHEGDFLLIPPDVFHYTRYPRGTCLRSNVFFRESDIDGRAAELMPEGRKFFSDTRVFHLPEAYRSQISALLNRMTREERINDERSAPMLGALLTELLLLCGRECSFVSELPDRIHTTDLPIVRAAQYMSEHYMDDITSADIAAAAGYSLNYLTRRFREAAGIGVHEYLMFIRLQRAALQLVSTDRTVTDIAISCGFSDSNYFKDAFKKKYGVTPRAYRK